MALKGDDEVFSSSEIIAGCGGSTYNAVDRLADKGELIREGRRFRKGKIMPVWNSWEKDQERRDAHMRALLDSVKPLLDQARQEEREAIKEIILAEKGMHTFTKSPIGVAVCDSILATIEAEREK